ncbi:MAG: TRAP transporter substrate-binding protein DctP [Elusimicrobia bacterium]|nr:TRAP transporter substrate-binding protein DctP [Elusimicrobiota bacterium]MDE2312867.1 TRAP transporter substrate-binding protein DctP [Elusimicrobiota bacterium]
MTTSDKPAACPLVMALAALASLLLPAAAQSASIRFATLAPEGSTWMNIMTEFNAELKEKTGGQLEFKMYPGGVQGDDRDVVKKMQIGELQAAGLTGVGLGMIAPSVRILDSPWLFHNAHELEAIHEQFDPEFSRDFEKGGYVLLGWTDLGFVYVFSQNPIERPADFRAQKMWMWEGDPIAQAAYQALGVDPVPLSVIDVMASLETGLINAVYGPPLGVVALQWFTQAKYIYSEPLAYSSGAVVMRKKTFDALPQAQQKALLSLGRKYFARLNGMTRRENGQALRSLESQGLKMSSKPSIADVALYDKLGHQARLSLIGKLYTADLLKRVESSLAKLRGKRIRRAHR